MPAAADWAGLGWLGWAVIPPAEVITQLLGDTAAAGQLGRELEIICGVNQVSSTVSWQLPAASWGVEGGVTQARLSSRWPGLGSGGAPAVRPCDVCRELRSPAPATAAAGAGLGFLLSAVPRQLPVSTLYTPGTWRQVAATPTLPPRTTPPHHGKATWIGHTYLCGSRKQNHTFIHIYSHLHKSALGTPSHGNV